MRQLKKFLITKVTFLVLSINLTSSPLYGSELTMSISDAPPIEVEAQKVCKPESLDVVRLHVRKILMEYLGLKKEEIQPTSDFQLHLAASDLDMVGIQMLLEERFKIKMTDLQRDLARTVRDLEHTVYKQQCL